MTSILNLCAFDLALSRHTAALSTSLISSIPLPGLATLRAVSLPARGLSKERHSPERYSRLLKNIVNKNSKMELLLNFLAIQ